MSSKLKNYKKKAGKMRPRTMSDALRRGVSSVAPTSIPQVRADIQSARRVAEPFLLFQGNPDSGGLANYAEARKVADKLMGMCDHAERLCNESDRKARESRGL